MTAPDVQISPDTVRLTAAKMLALADEVRATIAAAQVDTVRADAPSGFHATQAANALWAAWSGQLDQTATDTALFGHDIAEAMTVWEQADAEIAARLGGG